MTYPYSEPFNGEKSADAAGTRLGGPRRIRHRSAPHLVRVEVVGAGSRQVSA